MIPWVQLPIQDYDSFVFNDYSHFEKVGRVDLTAGDKLVGIFNLDCEYCQEAASKLANWEREKKKKYHSMPFISYRGPKQLLNLRGRPKVLFPMLLLTTKHFLNLLGVHRPESTI